MTSLDATALPKPDAGHPRDIARTAVRTLALMFGPLVEAYRARRDTEHLLGLNDSLLKDIGVTRREIDAVVRTSQTRWSM